MKHTLAILTLLLTPTLALMAGKPVVAQAPTVTVSCSICTPGETILIHGSGFGQRASLTVAIGGAWGFSMPASSDRKGNFTVSYVLGQYTPAGEYVVSATSGSASATDTFEIQ